MGKRIGNQLNMPAECVDGKMPMERKEKHSGFTISIKECCHEKNIHLVFFFLKVYIISEKDFRIKYPIN